MTMTQVHVAPPPLLPKAPSSVVIHLSSEDISELYQWASSSPNTNSVHFNVKQIHSTLLAKNKFRSFQRQAARGSEKHPHEKGN
jgi:hypothetical protein